MHSRALDVIIYSRKYKSYSLVLLNLFILMLADWFARKNLRRHSDIHNVYYYWCDSGSFNYCRDNSWWGSPFGILRSPWWSFNFWKTVPDIPLFNWLRLIKLLKSKLGISLLHVSARCNLQEVTILQIRTTSITTAIQGSANICGSISS